MFNCWKSWRRVKSHNWPSRSRPFCFHMSANLLNPPFWRRREPEGRAQQSLTVIHVSPLDMDFFTGKGWAEPLRGLWPARWKCPTAQEAPRARGEPCQFVFWAPHGVQETPHGAQQSTTKASRRVLNVCGGLGLLLLLPQVVLHHHVEQDGEYQQADDDVQLHVHADERAQEEGEAGTQALQHAEILERRVVVFRTAQVHQHCNRWHSDNSALQSQKAVTA